ncbi:MAG: hypothetical protein L0H64_14355 [Pseudonocardia sp.]|nr:hypothetical protein [Pseudonocardia sp.]
MTGIREIVIAARAGIENLEPADLAAELDRLGVLLVDVREPAETAYGAIPGAVLVPRGLLEFHADSGNPSTSTGSYPAGGWSSTARPGPAPPSPSARCTSSATAMWPTSTAGSTPGWPRAGP